MGWGLLFAFLAAICTAGATILQAIGARHARHFRSVDPRLLLSVIKSALIIGYFMHMKFETALMRWMITLSVIACFVIMYFFFFPDAGRITTLGVK